MSPRAAKRTPKRKLPFTELVLKMHKSPALLARYRKNPRAIEKQHGLTAPQGKALRSGSIVKIKAQIAKEFASKLSPFVTQGEIDLSPKFVHGGIDFS